MPRRRNYSRSVARRRPRYDDYYSYPRRRGGCLAPIRRFFRNLAIILLVATGVVAFFLLVLLIAFNFAIAVQIFYYILFIAAGVAILGVLYVMVRIIAGISQRISAASVARSQARIEKERIQQARVQTRQGNVQIRAQEAKIERENYALYQRYEQPGLSQMPRRTRNIHDYPSPGSPLQQSPYQTRNLHRGYQEPLVRVLPALSSMPPDPEPGAAQETELEALGMPAKGQVFAYRNYKKYLKPGQLIIGIRKDGSPRIGSWDDFKITLILGSSSSGKSTTVLEKCSSLGGNGGQLVICDPGGFKPDSLTRRLGPLQLALMPRTTIALEHADIMQNLERFRVELEHRRRGADMTAPILLVIDELNGLLMDKDIKKELTELIEKFAQQARGYNMYMILCAQRASGLAAIRNSVISFVCHKCPEMEASKILPARYARLAPELGTGQTFVSDANGFIEPLQQIFISAEDIASSVGGAQYPRSIPHHPETEPLAPRQNYGAPAYRQTRTPQAPAHQQGASQKLILRRTHLVQQDQSSAPQSPSKQPSAGAIWGEETQANPPTQSARPPTSPTGPMTEELVPKRQKTASSEPRQATHSSWRREADGSPDDTIIVPDLFPSVQSTPDSLEPPAPHSKGPAHPDQLSRLAQLRKRQKR